MLNDQLKIILTLRLTRRKFVTNINVISRRIIMRNGIIKVYISMENIHWSYRLLNQIYFAKMQRKTPGITKLVIQVLIIIIIIQVLTFPNTRRNYRRLPLEVIITPAS